jgi:D-glycero-D-manno-heptose 1,7-bisphosphate phosphatase
METVPGTQVHADLAAFAESIIQSERSARNAAGNGDSSFGRFD